MDEMEDSEFVATEHDRLVSAITKLDKTQHITEPSRNEPTNLNSEFNLIKRQNRLNLENVARVLEKTAQHVNISKKFKKTQDVKKVLSKPLEKPQAERFKRAAGYEANKKKIGRWDPVVARGRTVDFVTFPIKHVNTKLAPTGEFLSKFKLKSELEKELEEVDPPAIQEMDEEEDEQAFPMSYEEMVEHRQNLAKLRAQESYKAAKAKRQSKIKSKKYHRVLKKEKLKQQLKEFEELQKKDPEEALKMLEVLEKSRALERHTLRHKNTGKWAKNKLIRAKYDKEVRQELAEQLAVSRSLTKKVQNQESSDDEEDGNIPDITLSQDPMNPWMMERSDKSNVNAEFDFGYKKYLQNKMPVKKDTDSDTDDETAPNNELNALKEGITRLSNLNHDNNDQDDSDQDQESLVEESNTDVKVAGKSYAKPAKNLQTVKEKQSTKRKLPETVTKTTKSKVKKPTATTEWIVETVERNHEDTSEQITSAFESHETNIAKEVEKKLRALRQNIERLEKTSQSDKIENKRKNRDSKDDDNLEYLKLKKKNPKAIIDEELIETASPNNTEQGKKDNTAADLIKKVDALLKTQDSTSTDIDPNRFIKVKPKYLNTALSQGENALDQLDDDEQVVPRVNIEEVFEEDDVVASFRQEKKDEIDKDKPQDIDLSLPGWGTWGGKGVKPQKKKRNRFILKAPPPSLRRDENKGDIIIKEYKDAKLASHKVKDVPFPFDSVKDYEASIRLPLGNTFIPEKAHKKLIRPSVITKAGQVIEPMDEEELLVPRNKNYRNKDVIQLLSKK